MRHLLKMTWRNFKSRPVTNSINLVGLGVSLALMIILSAYCYNELTTDSFHKKAKQIYLICNEREIDTYGSISPGILKTQLDWQVPDVKSSVRLTQTLKRPVFEVGDREPVTSEMFFADPTFFQLFSYRALSGNLENALKEPMSLVLTDSEARRLFGKESALGKTVKINHEHLLTVTAVIEEPQGNSCISIKTIAPIAAMANLQPSEGDFTNWGQRNYLTFVQIANPDKVKEIENQIDRLFPQDIQKDRKTTLIPLKQIYLSKNGITSHISYIKVGDRTRIMILLVITLLILIIALINYINISSSHWLERNIEVGIQKVLGASRLHILRNILFEALLIFLASTALAFITATVVTPYISNYTGIAFPSALFLSPLFMATLLLCMVVLSLAATLFPALKISRSKIGDNLKRTVSFKAHRLSVQQIFVVFQFTAAIVLVAFTILVQKQVRFGCSKLSLNKENVLAIAVTDQLGAKRDVLKKSLQEQAGVQKVSFSEFYPGSPGSNRWLNLTFKGEEKNADFWGFVTDAAFWEIMGIKLVSGRLFTDDLASDKGKVLVNETFLKSHAIKNPIGATFGFDYQIIGVVKDFHFQPVTIPIAPLAIICGEAKRNFSPGVPLCYVKVQASSIHALSKVRVRIKRICAALSPAFPVEISFLDDAVENLYQSETRFQRAFSIFAGCALVICCLGILALSLFACQRRTKEIAIRKVNGASATEILALLNKDFMKWVALAFGIACPIAWYITNNWLQNFAYKTELSLWVFALAGAVALAVALLTVSWQAWRAASRNPVESLRYE